MMLIFLGGTRSFEWAALWNWIVQVDVVYNDPCLVTLPRKMNTSPLKYSGFFFVAGLRLWVSMDDYGSFLGV